VVGYQQNGDGTAYVSFEDEEAPRRALFELQNRHFRGISNHSAKLLARFSPGRHQDRYMISKMGHSSCNQECYYWRTTGCTGCDRLHHLFCQGIDFQPWMAKYYDP